MLSGKPKTRVSPVFFDLALSAHLFQRFVAPPPTPFSHQDQRLIVTHDFAPLHVVRLFVCLLSLFDRADDERR